MMKVRAIEVFPCHTFVKGPQGPGESEMMLLVVPLEWEGQRMHGSPSASIAQHLMHFIHQQTVQSTFQILPFASW